MTRPMAIAALSLVLGAGIAAQTTLTGAWQGETNNGASIVLDLTVKEDTLTGTLTRNGESTPIADGKVSKDTFSFKATLNGKSEGLSGERAGDELKVWLDRQGRETAIVLKRVKRTAPGR